MQKDLSDVLTSAAPKAPGNYKIGNVEVHEVIVSPPVVILIPEDLDKQGEI